MNTTFSKRSVKRARIFLIDWFREWHETHDVAKMTDFDETITGSNWRLETLMFDSSWHRTPFFHALKEMVIDGTIEFKKNEKNECTYRLKI